MTNKQPIRILIADDHPVVRRGFRYLIESMPNLELVGEAEEGGKAIELAQRLKPDVILLDLVMPNIDGLTALQIIKQNDPDARILVVTSFADDDKVFPAIKAGASGYLLKDTSPEALVQAIENVYQGQGSLHPTIARKLMQELHQPPSLPPTADPLTKREVEVLKLVARGLSNPNIAAKLGITQGTVRVHINRLLGKLHLANRTQAALYAIQEGFIDSDQL